MAERPFSAYSGDAPYVFVSYAHQDADFVYAELTWLREQGINVWYDEGITPGSRWSDALANALERAAHFVFFVSPRSAASQNCVDEVGFALERDKPVLAVHLEPTRLSPGLALRLGSRQAILKHELAESAYRAKLAGALAAYATLPDPPTSQAQPPQRAELIETIFSSIAVVPIENRSESAELDDLAATLTEDVLSTFSGVWWGRLIGPAETRRFLDAHASATDIAGNLGVGSVLMGSVRQQGRNVRITMELVNAVGEHVWSERLQEPLDTIFDRVEHVGDRIVWSLTTGVREHQWKQVADAPADELGPWGLRYKAWRLALRPYMDADAQREYRRLLERAIGLDPNEPEFKTLLASMLANNVMQGFSADREGDARRARELLEKAVPSASGMSLMYAGLAFGFLGDHARAVALCRRAYEKVPRFVPAKWQYAQQLLHAGQAADALAIYEEAETLKLPGQISPYSLMAQAYAITGDLQTALAMSQTAVDANPDLGALTTHANLLALAGRVDEAVKILERIRSSVPRFTLRASINAYRRTFATEEAREAVTAGLQKLIDLGHQ